jgi:hypothetical protein
MGTNELDYFSGIELNNKGLTPEAGKHDHKSDELIRGLIQRIIACSPKSN